MPPNNQNAILVFTTERRKEHIAVKPKNVPFWQYTREEETYHQISGKYIHHSPIREVSQYKRCIHSSTRHWTQQESLNIPYTIIENTAGATHIRNSRFTYRGHLARTAIPKKPFLPPDLPLLQSGCATCRGAVAPVGEIQQLDAEQDKDPLRTDNPSAVIHD